MIEIFILSLIQGITEFLPVSSSSHLIIASEYLKLEKSLSIDVSLHLGSFLAVIVYFNKDVLNFYKNKILFFKIIISSIPVMMVGVILIETNFIEKIRSIETIAWTTFIFGIMLFVSDKFKIKKTIDMLKKKKDDNQPTKIKTGGSTFKNPVSQTSEKVWQLIKKSVPLSTSFGEAAISEKHCNFLINKRNASFDDMLNLIKFIKRNVKLKTGINLETEIEIIE